MHCQKQTQIYYQIIHIFPEISTFIASVLNLKIPLVKVTYIIFFQNFRISAFV